MIERFVDTSGWAEWADTTLQYHSLSVAAFDEVWNQGGRLMATSLVLAPHTQVKTDTTAR